MRVNIAPKACLAVSCITYSGMVLNTLPVWLQELSQGYSLAISESGLLATSIILFAAAACFCYPRMADSARLVVVLSASAITMAAVGWVYGFAAEALYGLATVFGIALGGLFGAGIFLALSNGQSLLWLSQGISFGLFLALVTLLINAMTGWSVLLAIAFGAFIIGTLAATLSIPTGTEKIGRLFHLKTSLPMLLFLPFFIAMGGFWAFLAIYAQSVSITSVSLLISGGLLVSSVAALLPNVCGEKNTTALYIVSVVLAALGAGIVYLSHNLLWFGIGLFLNSLFLFSFLPIFIARSSMINDKEIQLFGISLYIVGLALGGAVAGLIIEVLGYAVFAFAIVVSALPALLPMSKAIQFRDAPP